MSKLVDCHCHLEDEEFDKDRKNVIEQARNLGISMITSGLGLDGAKKAAKIASEFSGVHACAGLAPYSKEDPRGVIEFIKENKNKLVGIGENVEKVMMHAFDGKASNAMKGVEVGFMFSIPTSVVRSVQKQKLVRLLPLENLLLETDSPVLGVDKKSRNEPRFLIESVKKIAELKSISVDKVVEVTTENANNLFRLI